VLGALKITDMKKNIYFYQTDFRPFKLANLLPKLQLSKHVQGWFFIRTYTVKWFRFAITFSLTKQSDLRLPRRIAHRINVFNYMS